MRNIWRIFCADWKRLTASVVAVVVMLGLCLVPCLYGGSTSCPTGIPTAPPPPAASRWR